MSPSPLAGQPAPRALLENIPRLVSAYYTLSPDPDDPHQAVLFGTSGHRGSSLDGRFNETHILAVTQAICEHRHETDTKGPLFLGIDTHALSEPAFRTALEVLAANQVEVRIAAGNAYTPTPALSFAILEWNRSSSSLADGIVITPSHNPPRDGGFKYNPPDGGPAGGEITRKVQERANALIANKNRDVKRMSFEKALKCSTTQFHDFITPYVESLPTIVDIEAIKSSGLRLGADPMGGAGVGFFEPMREILGLEIYVTSTSVDPTFAFMHLDKDGKIRMDCSSRYAMSGLIGMKDSFDIAFGNDTDFDRHGIVTKSKGLLNPNHYLAVAIEYLFSTRKNWTGAGIGKTSVSSSMIDRVAHALGRSLVEVPVGFKWFVEGLGTGALGFGGEESAGASFLRFDKRSWSTDKDGIIMGLLAAEMTAKTGRDPGELYEQLEQRFGSPIYERMDAPATPAEKVLLGALSPEKVTASELAGEPILEKLTRAPGNGASLGGLKVVTKNGWFAARPSGTEDVYKIYTESFLGPEHLKAIQTEAQAIVTDALR